MRLECTAIAALIDVDVTRPLHKDADGRFYMISRALANSIVTDASVPMCPVFIEHNEMYRIGHIVRFRIEERLVDNHRRCVLVTDFEIDDEYFVQTLRDALKVRVNDILTVPYRSPDNFIDDDIHGSAAPVYDDTGTIVIGADDADDVLDAGAHLGLTLKFPAVSLRHNNKTNLVEELSVCLAGARDATVITSVIFNPDVPGVTDGANDVNAFNQFLAANMAMNSLQVMKTARDLKALNMPMECMVYKYKPSVEEKCALVEDAIDRVTTSSSGEKCALAKETVDIVTKSTSNVTTNPSLPKGILLH